MDTSDVDIDSLLLQQFRSMATQDRDVLVAEFQRLLGNQVNDASCAFYLDMNNWNLQDAICSYLEYHSEQPIHRLNPAPEMTIIPLGADPFNPEQTPTIVAPNTSFTRVWHIMNSGNDSWPVGCSLRRVDGFQLSTSDQIVVDGLLPNASTTVRLDIVSPAICGLYREQWRMTTLTGALFGTSLWVVLQVVADDIISSLSSSMQSVAVTTDANIANATHPHGLQLASVAELLSGDASVVSNAASSCPLLHAAISPDTNNADNMDMS